VPDRWRVSLLGMADNFLCPVQHRWQTRTGKSACPTRTRQHIGLAAVALDHRIMLTLIGASLLVLLISRRERSMMRRQIPRGSEHEYSIGHPYDELALRQAESWSRRGYLMECRVATPSPLNSERLVRPNDSARSSYECSRAA
jgi:hypothetical protein